MDKDFIGPFNDNADVYYNFFVPDTQVVNGKRFSIFYFHPATPGKIHLKAMHGCMPPLFRYKNKPVLR